MTRVVIKDEQGFLEKVSKLKAAGASGLHVITDFDRTITKELVGGEQVSTSYDLVDGCIGEPYLSNVKEWMAHYYQIEKSHEHPDEFKFSMMEEWWDKYYSQLVECGLKFEDLRRELQKRPIHLRDGATQFFKRLSHRKIPVLIFSAGVGNVIEEYLKKHGLHSGNIHIVSNYLEFKNGSVVGYTKPFIHPLNKDERHVKAANYKGEIEKRRNVILLGDSLSDLAMSGGISHDCIIRIGFLNTHIEKRMDAYSKSFDAVIVGDGDFGFVNDVLCQILGQDLVS